MSKRLFKTLAAVLAIAAAAAGPVRGQNASPDVTLDFTTNDWGLPTSGLNHGPANYTSGGNTITVYANNTYRFVSDYLILGKRDSYLQLPAFSSPVEKIEVVGNSGASETVEQNVFVDENNSWVAVSTETMGATGTNTYVIDENYRAAGNIYFIKVESSANTQITYIKVYYVSSGGGSTPEPPAPAVPHTVRFADGNNGWQVQDVTAATSAVAPAVLENVMAGDSLVVTAPATLPGKVKSVKAVKYVPPAATVTTAPTATAAYIEANSTSALVNAGAADGGSMMYAVTATNAQPASTADFSATIPTAQGRSAGTYYVWYYVEGDADHSDSEIAGPVSVTLAVMTTVTINQSDWGTTGKSFTKDGVTVSVGSIDRGYGNITGGGTFSTTLGKFTRIVVTTGSCEASGTGWSGSYSSMTWAGTPASTVSFSGNFMGMGMVQTTFVCTIVSTN